MKSTFYTLMLLAALSSCQSNSEQQNASDEAPKLSGQSAVTDNESQKDVVKVAVGSPDHTTLVTVIKAAGLVDALSNAGPFTVFAPTNEAFEKLPKGTVEDLLKPENKENLKTVLEHHVMTSALASDFFQDGQKMGMVDGTDVTFYIKGKDVYIGDSKIIASVRASNGWVHIVDKVVLTK